MNLWNQVLIVGTHRTLMASWVEALGILVQRNDWLATHQVFDLSSVNTLSDWLLSFFMIRRRLSLSDSLVFVAGASFLRRRSKWNWLYTSLLYVFGLLLSDSALMSDSALLGLLIFFKFFCMIQIVLEVVIENHGLLGAFEVAFLRNEKLL